MKPLEEIRKEFYKGYTSYYPGDSGMFGGDPCEPIFEMAADPKDIADFWLSQIESEREGLRAAVEKMAKKGNPEYETNQDHGYNKALCEVLSLIPKKL